jgi:arylsulfatase A-like enzyme
MARRQDGACVGMLAKQLTLLPLLGALVSMFVGACTGDASSPTDHGRARGAKSNRPPNVLIIITDDQRTGMLRVMPETRRFFRRGGTEFINAFVTTPQCCPSRASIFTGRYAHNHGVVENNDGDELDHDTTLQYYLKRAGYQTAIVGKFLQGRPISRDPEEFDRWAITGWGYYDRQFNLNGRMREVHAYSTDYMARVAVRWLHDFEQDEGRPWLMYVAPNAPHLPYEPHRKYRGVAVPHWRGNPATREEDRSDKASFIGKSNVTSRESASVYEDQERTLKSVDDLVGRIFRSLRDLNERRTTLAFFISDNGHLHGEHGLFGKRLPYAASVRVPLLIRWPGRVRNGVIDDRIVANIDIVPTVMEAARVDAGAHSIDGFSLTGDAQRDALLLEQYKNGRIPDWVSVITSSDQYIEYRDDSGAFKFGEYYDLRADPWQLHNLLERGSPDGNPDARRAANRLNELLHCAGDACR